MYYLERDWDGLWLKKVSHLRYKQSNNDNNKRVQNIYSIVNQVLKPKVLFSSSPSFSVSDWLPTVWKLVFKVIEVVPVDDVALENLPTLNVVVATFFLRALGFAWRTLVEDEVVVEEGRVTIKGVDSGEIGVRIL